MASDIYDKNSMIDIVSDNFTINKGSITRKNGVITLKSNSRCTFEYNYSNGELQTNKLKVNYDLFSENANTRYNNNISIQLKIQFYNKDYDNENNEDTYTDGNWQTINLIPYNSTEKKGNYKNDIIDLDSDNIKYIGVIISFNNNTDSTAKLSLNKLSINKIKNGLSKSDLDDYVQSDDFKNYISDLVGDNTGSGECTGCGIYRPIFDIYSDLAHVEYRQERDGAFPNGYAFILLKTQEES